MEMDMSDISILLLSLTAIIAAFPKKNDKGQREWKTRDVITLCATLLITPLSFFINYETKRDNETTKENWERLKTDNAKLLRSDSISNENNHVLIKELVTTKSELNSVREILDQSRNSLKEAQFELVSIKNAQIEELKKQERIRKEDEVLKYIQDDLYPLLADLQADYFDVALSARIPAKFNSISQIRDSQRKMSDSSRFIPDKFGVLKRLSFECDPYVKSEIEDFLSKFPILLDGLSLFDLFKKGKKEKDEKISLPKELFGAPEELNKLMENIINWKRKL